MHTTEIIEQKSISDECWSITIRCCNDPSTDSVRTIHAVVRDRTGVLNQRTDEDLQTDIDQHHDEVMSRHAAKMAGKLAINLGQRTKIHS